MRRHRTGGPVHSVPPDGLLANLRLSQEAEARRRESEAATASASLDISGEEAYLRRAAMSGVAPDAAAQGDAAAAPSRPGGMSLAERMMKNMGWKEVRPAAGGALFGCQPLTVCSRSALHHTHRAACDIRLLAALLSRQPLSCTLNLSSCSRCQQPTVDVPSPAVFPQGQGLGKDGQGIATPLMMKKVGKGAGEIVAAQPLPVQPEKKQKVCSARCGFLLRTGNSPPRSTAVGNPATAPLTVGSLLARKRLHASSLALLLALFSSSFPNRRR